MDQQSFFADITTPAHPRCASRTAARPLREALAPYVDLAQLRQLVARGGDVRQALKQAGRTPEEAQALIDALALLLRPAEREQIKSPADVAALLLVEMALLDQEQLKVVCLNTKNRVQEVALIYQGSLNTALIRVGELFKPAIRHNSAAIVVAHNHPSGDPTPSPEDVRVTRQIVEAGKLLDIEVLDRAPWACAYRYAHHVCIAMLRKETGSYHSLSLTRQATGAIPPVV